MVDITAYTSSYYTTPCWGYVFATCTNNAGKIVEIHTAGPYPDSSYTWYKVLNQGCQIAYVPKGMKIKSTGGSETGTVRFYKLDAYN